MLNRILDHAAPDIFTVIIVAGFLALSVTQTHKAKAYQAEVNLLAAAIPASALQEPVKASPKFVKPKKKPTPPDQIGDFIRGMK